MHAFAACDLTGWYCQPAHDPFKARQVETPVRHFQSSSVSSRRANLSHHGRCLARAGPATTTFIPFESLQKAERYDIRLYKPRFVVETEYQRRDEGFLALADYLGGANTAGLRLEATQPVVMLYEPLGRKMMQLYVSGQPEGQDLLAEQPPFPISTEVSLQIAGGEALAIMKFSGNATLQATTAARDSLKRLLEADGLALAEAEATGTFRLAQYGPLHSLSERVNEVWLGIVM